MPVLNWAGKRSRICSLFKDQKKTLVEVKALIEEEDPTFTACVRSYHNWLTKWNCDKNKSTIREDRRRQRRRARYDTRPAAAELHSPDASYADDLDANGNNVHSVLPRYSHSWLEPYFTINTLLGSSLEPQSPRASADTLSPHRLPPVDLTTLQDKDDIELDVQDHEGKTSLHQAVIDGSLTKVKHLLSLGAPLDVLDNTNYKPIHYAAATGMSSIITELLRSGDDVNVKGPDGKSPLHLAILFPKAVKILLDYSAAVSAKDDHGDTPLHLALSARRSCDDIAKKLLRSGANINIRNAAGATPFHSVIDKIPEDEPRPNRLLMLFFEYGADVSLQTKDDKTAFEHFLNRVNIEARIRKGRQEYSDVMAFVQEGANVDVRLASGETLLQIILSSQDLIWSNQSLIETFCETSNEIHQCSPTGKYPLHTCMETFCLPNGSSGPYTKHIQILLCRGANPSQRNKAGSSPVMHLLSCNLQRNPNLSLDALKLLMDSKADPFKRDPNGDLPIYHVNKMHSIKIQKLWIEALVGWYINNESTQEEESSWWTDYRSLRIQGRWSSSTHLLMDEARSEMPANVVPNLPKTLLKMAAEEFLEYSKCELERLKQDHDSEHSATQVERDHVILILRDCKKLALDIDLSWFQIVLDFFQ